ncbi:hypothetical protein [Streptosporangium sp. NPDC003464]
MNEANRWNTSPSPPRRPAVGQTASHGASSFVDHGDGRTRVRVRRPL